MHINLMCTQNNYLFYFNYKQLIEIKIKKNHFFKYTIKPLVEYYTL